MNFLMIPLLGLVSFQPLAGQAPLALVGTIDLPRVEGRIDHLAFDAATQRLFVAALGNNTVEVLDLKSGTHVKSLTGIICGRRVSTDRSEHLRHGLSHLRTRREQSMRWLQPMRSQVGTAGQMFLACV